MTRFVALLVLLLSVRLLSAPTLASAQLACAEGRERDRTGRCCWPGQHYSVAHARCEGVPACPGGLVEHGDDCVARAGAVMVMPAPSTAPPASAAPEPDTLEPATYPSLDDPSPTGGPTEGGETLEPGAVPPPPTTTPEHVTGYLPRGYEIGVRATPTAWPLFGEIGRAHARRPVQSVGKDAGLLFLSMTMHGLGWLIGWLVPIIDEAAGNCGTFTGGFGTERGSCGTWPLTFIPIVGSFIAGVSSFDTSRFSSGMGFAVGLPSMLLQTAGLITVIVALSGSTTDYHFEPLEAELGDAALSLSFDAPNSDAGASLTVRF